MPEGIEQGVPVMDIAAAERMVERLAVVRYDDEKAYEQRESRGRLVHEFLRRTARWAVALGAEERWPHSDLAKAMAPDLALDAAFIEDKIDFDSGVRGEFPLRREIVYPMVCWRRSVTCRVGGAKSWTTRTSRCC